MIVVQWQFWKKGFPTSHSCGYSDYVPQCVWQTYRKGTMKSQTSAQGRLLLWYVCCYDTHYEESNQCPRETSVVILYVCCYDTWRKHTNMKHLKNENREQPSLLVCQTYVRKRKGAVKMRMTVLKMHITCKQKCDWNVCELWFTAYGTQISYKNASSNAPSP